jgi:hypothetical protein
MEQQDTQMASVVPELTDGVITLNAYTNDDVLAHLGGEAEETARRFGWWPHRHRGHRPGRHQLLGPPLGNQRPGTGFRRPRDGDRATGRRLRTAHRTLRASAGVLLDRCQPAPRGHATRALALLLQYARSIGVTQAEAIIATGNLASRRVAEKTGFRLASTVTAQDDTDMIRYQSWLQNI